MSNNHYIKGRNKEYACMRQLEQEGYLALRQAGSHSPFDVIAFLTLPDNPNEKSLIRAIQCKAMKYVGKKEIKKLKDLKIPAIIQKELWHFRRYQKPAIHIC